MKSVIKRLVIQRKELTVEQLCKGLQVCGFDTNEPEVFERVLEHLDSLKEGMFLEEQANLIRLVDDWPGKLVPVIVTLKFFINGNHVETWKQKTIEEQSWVGKERLLSGNTFEWLWDFCETNESILCCQLVTKRNGRRRIDFPLAGFKVSDTNSQIMSRVKVETRRFKPSVNDLLEMDESLVRAYNKQEEWLLGCN